jgi:hypothetical protein
MKSAIMPMFCVILATPFCVALDSAHNVSDKWSSASLQAVRDSKLGGGWPGQTSS